MQIELLMKLVLLLLLSDAVSSSASKQYYTAKADLVYIGGQLTERFCKIEVLTDTTNGSDRVKQLMLGINFNNELITNGFVLTLDLSKKTKGSVPSLMSVQDLSTFKQTSYQPVSFRLDVSNDTDRWDEMRAGFEGNSEQHEPSISFRISNIEEFQASSKAFSFAAKHTLLVLIQLVVIILQSYKVLWFPERFGCEYPRMAIAFSWTTDGLIMYLFLRVFQDYFYLGLPQVFVLALQLPAFWMMYDYETEYSKISDKKSCLFLIIGGLFCFAQLAVCALSPNSLPLAASAVFLVLVCDQFLSAIERSNLLYSLGLFFPKIVQLCLIFFDKSSPLMCLVNQTSFLLTALLVLTFFLLLFVQWRSGPRCGIKSQLIDRNEYLYRPRNMVLDDLLIDQKIQETDVCGICLIPLTETFTGNSKMLDDSTNHNENDFSLGKSREARWDERLTMMQVTKCGHIFHRSCLEAWNLTNESCPLCRKTVIS